MNIYDRFIYKAGRISYILSAAFMIAALLVNLVPAAPAFAVQPPTVTICHAAGQAGTTTFQTLYDLPWVAVYNNNEQAGHFNENGTVKAGHENDYLGACVTPPTATNTSVPPTPTNTSVPPTATNTSVPPTPTNTSVPPTATNTTTPTNTSVSPTATNTTTPTNTSVPPTATNTGVAPTATNTLIPPTATNTGVAPTATEPNPTDVPTDEPLIPVTGQTVLIPVTGMDFGTGRFGSQGLFLASIAFFGLGLVLSGAARKQEE